MATQVLLFAALRDAAGCSHAAVDAVTVAAMVDELVDRFGPTFARRMAVATVLVDGVVEAHDSPRRLSGSEEVALLPPFSGG